jgi:hypothetical protein
MTGRLTDNDTAVPLLRIFIGFGLNTEPGFYLVPLLFGRLVLKIKLHTVTGLQFYYAAALRFSPVWNLT